jgi:hypothetical protein
VLPLDTTQRAHGRLAVIVPAGHARLWPDDDVLADLRLVACLACEIALLKNVRDSDFDRKLRWIVEQRSRAAVA